MNIRVEVNSLASKNLSGVGYFTKRLTEALIHHKNTRVKAFSFNLLNRQPTPVVNGKVTQEVNTVFPLRVYAKLQSHGLALPFDFNLKPVDLTIFTNYARWPSVKSRYTATTIHDLTFIKYPDLVETNNLAHLQRIVKRSITSSDFIITVSEAIKTELVTEFKVNPNTVISTPIPPDEAFFKKNTNEVHKKYNIPTKKYLFFISTIEPRKNVPYIIDAYTRLPEALRSEYGLVLSGGMGWKSEKSIAAITKAQKQGFSIIHTGYIDENDKSALYQQASAFLFPSLYEGFGMPILEAAASKTPIITSDIPVLREAAGEGALYVNPQNPTSLTSAIKELLTDNNLQKELVKRASKHLATFSWEKNADAIINKVNELDERRKNR